MVQDEHKEPKQGGRKMIDSERSTAECTTCGEGKPLVSFHGKSKGPLGRNGKCADCVNLWIKDWRASKPGYNAALVKKNRAKFHAMDRTDAMPDFAGGEQPVSRDEAFRRLYYWRGKARIHDCECGARAQRWTYLGDCPREMSATIQLCGKTRTVRYSPDPLRYEPMCNRCGYLFRAGQAR